MTTQVIIHRRYSHPGFCTEFPVIADYTFSHALSHYIFQSWFFINNHVINVYIQQHLVSVSLFIHAHMISTRSYSYSISARRSISPNHVPCRTAHPMIRLSILPVQESPSTSHNGLFTCHRHRCYRL